MTVKFTVPMNTFARWLLLLACLSARAFAHEVPIPINHMTLNADPGRISVHLHTGAPWWISELLDERTPPPTGWSAEAQAAVKTYFDRHFTLSANGRPLASRLLYCRYSEEIWNYILGSQLDLEFSYELPADVRELSGSATFYAEERGKVPAPFLTYLKISGRAARMLTLTPGRPSFSFPIADLWRTPAQRRRQAWQAGLAFWQAQPWLVLLLAALQLQSRTRWPAPLYAGGVAAADAAGAAVAAWPQESAVFFALGAFFALAVIAGAIEAGLRLYERRLRRASQSQAGRLFNGQVRFLSLLTGGIALFLLAQNLGARR